MIDDEELRAFATQQVEVMAIHYLAGRYRRLRRGDHEHVGWEPPVPLPDTHAMGPTWPRACSSSRAVNWSDSRSGGQRKRGSDALIHVFADACVVQAYLSRERGQRTAGARSIGEGHLTSAGAFA